jgi:GMP synthase (glutamine-hydrolysing)
MKRVVVCQHVAHEILGTLDPLLKAHGFRIKYVNFGRHPTARPALDAYDGLVILGGPMNADEDALHPFLAHEKDLIRRAVAVGKPVLGICLGAQLMARALGGTVYRSGEKEIGWYDLDLTAAGAADPLLGHFRATEKVVQWHGDTFTLPPGAVHLASSRACVHQAFRVGERAYGLQFHIEVDEPMIERWLRIPSNQHEIEALGGHVTAQGIRADTHRHMRRLTRVARGAFTAFIELFGV